MQNSRESKLNDPFSNLAFKSKHNNVALGCYGRHLGGDILRPKYWR